MLLLLLESICINILPFSTIILSLYPHSKFFTEIYHKHKELFIMIKSTLACIMAFFAFLINAQAQSNYWQQRVKYTMNIDMDVITNRLTGTQKLVYTNNSPDKLDKLFYHLYFNAFQPGSSMDVRSR